MFSHRLLNQEITILASRGHLQSMFREVANIAEISLLLFDTFIFILQRLKLYDIMLPQMLEFLLLQGRSKKNG